MCLAKLNSSGTSPAIAIRSFIRIILLYLCDLAMHPQPETVVPAAPSSVHLTADQSTPVSSFVYVPFDTSYVYQVNKVPTV
jgi:hypothetical protein